MIQIRTDGDDIVTIDGPGVAEELDCEGSAVEVTVFDLQEGAAVVVTFLYQEAWEAVFRRTDEGHEMIACTIEQEENALLVTVHAGKEVSVAWKTIGLEEE